MLNKFFKKINPISAISNKLKSDEDDKQNEDLNNQVLNFEIDPMENLPSVQVYNSNNKPEEELTDYILPKQNEKINQKLQRKISKEIESDIVKNKDESYNSDDFNQNSSDSDYEYVQVTDSDQNENSDQKETSVSQDSKNGQNQELEVEKIEKGKKKYKTVKRKKNSQKKQTLGIQRDQLGNILVEEKNGKQFMKYRVKKEDTLYNICDDLNINVGMVMKLNDMVDEHIFPGKSLDILVTEDNEFMLKEQQSSIKGKTRKEHTQRQQQIILEEMKKQKQNKQYTVLYCTQIGNVLGELKIEDKLITFTPDLKDQDNQLTMKKRPGIKFNVVIDLKDVNEAFNITLPPQTSNDQEIMENEHDYTVQICLSTINKDISVKYKEKLEKLKKMKKSISFVDFKIYEYNLHGLYLNSDMKKNIADLIVDDINSAFYEQEEGNFDVMASQTVVPFYDILYDNLIEQIDSENEQETKRITIWDTLGVKPNFGGESRILNQEQMLEIIEFCVPNHFRLSNWDLIYSNMKHGTSISTLFRRCEYIEPCILIIEEFNGNVFGAYLSEYIKSGFKFYGTAECCVFRLLKEKYKAKIEKIKKKKSQEQMRTLKQSKSLSNIEGIMSESSHQDQDFKKELKQQRQTMLVLGQDKTSSEDEEDQQEKEQKEKEEQKIDNDQENKSQDKQKDRDGENKDKIGQTQESPEKETKELNSDDKLNNEQIHTNIEKSEQDQQDGNLQNQQECDQKENSDEDGEDDGDEENKNQDKNLQDSEKYELQYYNYTGKNENYIFADHEGIGIGGGDKYSIFINANFMEGLSNYSDTFDNPRLSVFESYNIKNIEIWGVVYDQ